MIHAGEEVYGIEGGGGEIFFFLEESFLTFEQNSQVAQHAETTSLLQKNRRIHC
jgi:hypothetical protein